MVCATNSLFWVCRKIIRWKYWGQKIGGGPAHHRSSRHRPPHYAHAPPGHQPLDPGPARPTPADRGFINHALSNVNLAYMQPTDVTAETPLPMVTKSLLTYSSEIGTEWLLERFEERPGRGDEYFGPIIPYLKRCLQTVVLLFLWNIFKCEGSQPLFVEKTKYKLISRCPLLSPCLLTPASSQ